AGTDMGAIDRDIHAVTVHAPVLRDAGQLAITVDIGPWHLPQQLRSVRRSDHRVVCYQRMRIPDPDDDHLFDCGGCLRSSDSRCQCGKARQDHGTAGRWESHDGDLSTMNNGLW